MGLPELTDDAMSGDVRALARLISVAERGGPPAMEVARIARARAGRAWVLGVTGAPGAGKSTLVGAIATAVRGRGERAAVIAVDPSSPISGGAVLGDRARMQEHATDPGVFVRSMAARGQLGGLARSTRTAVDLLDAAGWPLVIVETVGVGQAEVDVARASDTCLVVVTPGWGDALQVAKAGLMEVADIFVVNKADRPGVEQAVADLQAAVHLGDGAGWQVPVVPVVATAGEGIDDLLAAVDRHRAYQGDGHRHADRRRARAAADLRQAVADAVAAEAQERCQGPEFDRAVEEVAAGSVDPLSAAARLAKRP